MEGIFYIKEKIYVLIKLKLNSRWMGGFAFQVACLRLVANEPLFGVFAVPVDWPLLRQNLRVVEVHMVFRF